MLNNCVVATDKQGSRLGESSFLFRMTTTEEVNQIIHGLRSNYCGCESKDA